MFVHVCLADPLAMEITVDNLDNRLYNLENFLFQEVMRDMQGGFKANRQSILRRLAAVEQGNYQGNYRH